MQPNESIDWLCTMDQIFYLKDALDDQESSQLQWSLKNKHEGCSKTMTWDKMLRELEYKFLPAQYNQDKFLKFHKFQQLDSKVKEFMMEFTKLHVQLLYRRT